MLSQTAIASAMPKAARRAPCRVPGHWRTKTQTGRGEEDKNRCTPKNDIVFPTNQLESGKDNNAPQMIILISVPLLVSHKRDRGFQSVERQIRYVRRGRRCGRGGNVSARHTLAVSTRGRGVRWNTEPPSERKKRFAAFTAQRPAGFTNLLLMKNPPESNKSLAESAPELGPGKRETAPNVIRVRFIYRISYLLSAHRRASRSALPNSRISSKDSLRSDTFSGKDRGKTARFSLRANEALTEISLQNIFIHNRKFLF
ncbi:hypothetical protein EVAR_23711_1 [Eumeta japonica]|uniref:Uncharacterized protein n=1 Tax=Eumeta variegata TaxID=151549 RepID=A0A4C1VGB2_EUMVA|nr:hypothetical protein EVAR_23711_1 [Eumeta japonica]